MSVRRATDPVYLQYIWNAIEACSRNSVDASFHELLSCIQKECDSKCTAGKLQNELTNAISDGCIICNQRIYVKADISNLVPKDKHDWYCFECHGPGRVVSCPTCFRVFHPDCLTLAIETQLSFRLPYEDSSASNDSNSHNNLPPGYPCPVCQRLTRASKAVGLNTPSELHKIFLLALDWIRNKVNWKTMQVVGYLNEPIRNNYLVLRPINTRIIGERMRSDPTSKEGYSNRTALLVDLDNLVHNTAIFYGSKNDMSNMARQIRSLLRREMKESSFCVDCYLRSQSISSANRLTAPCRVAHRLLWFQHNGWSFRPCKMLYQNSEGYEVICFGGRHERVFVPLLRAVDMSFTALELGLRMTPPLKKALDEAEEYKANQSAYDRHVKQAGHSAVNDGSTSLGIDGNQSLMKLPNFEFKAKLTGTKKVKTPRKRKVPSRTLSVSSPHKLESSTTMVPKQSVKRRKSSRTNTSSYAPEDTAFGSHKWIDRFTDNSEDNLSSLSSLNSDSDSNIPTPEPSASSDIPGANISRPIITSGVKPTPGLEEKRSYKKKIDQHFDSFHDTLSSVASNFSLNSVAVRSGNSSSSELSAPSTSSKPQRTIRIKPLPSRTEETDTPIPAVKNEDSSRLRPLDNQCSRTKSGPSASSSSSAVSCPSSGRATIPAMVSDVPTPPESSVLSTSSTFSRTSNVSGRFNKSRKSSKLCKSLSKTRITLTNDDTSPGRLNLPSGLSYDTVTKAENRAKLIHGDNSYSQSHNSGSGFSKQVCRSPSPPSSLSDAESDLSSQASSVSTVSSPSTSQLSSSSLSSNSTLPSPNRRTSFSGLNSGANGNISVPELTKSTTLSGRASSLIRNSITDKVFSDNQVPKLTKVAKIGRRNQHQPTKTSNRSSLSEDPNCFKDPCPARDFQDEDPELNVIPLDKSVKPDKPNGNSRVSTDTDVRRHTRESPSLSAPNSSVKGTYSSHSSGFDVINSKLNSMVAHNTGWSGGSKLSSTYVDHTSSVHPVSGTGPTPPSNSSAASSCYSSVSPAALSSTSGLGSSLSDPKSVDASPGEMAGVPGGTSFSFSGNTNNHGTQLHHDVSMLKAEDHIHRIYSERIITLTTERDQAREEIHRRDILIADLKRAHEAEIKRVKQRTWCQVCLNEAFYHCCLGTAYCSEACQLQHWTLQHNRDCRRRAEAQQLLRQTRS